MGDANANARCKQAFKLIVNVPVLSGSDIRTHAPPSTIERVEFFVEEAGIGHGTLADDLTTRGVQTIHCTLMYLDVIF